MSEHRAISVRNGHAIADSMNPAPAPAPAPPPPDDEGPDWGRALNALRRHSTLLFVTMALGIAASVVVSRRFLPEFRSTTTIWIASQNEVQGRGQLGPIRQDQLLTWESWIDLLRSYAILDPVVRDLTLNLMPGSPSDSLVFRSFSSDVDVRPDRYKLRIYGDGAYTLMGRRKEVLEQGTLGDSIGKRFGFHWAPPKNPELFGETIPFEIITPRTASERLARTLDPYVDRTGSFLKVSLNGLSPIRTSVILNAVAARYVQVASDLKRRRLTEFSRNLEQQRSEAKENLVRAERELEQFRIRNVGMPSTTEGVAGAAGNAAAPADPLVTDGAELDRVKRDRRAIAGWLAAPAESRSANGPLIAEAPNADLKAALEELSRKRADLRTLKYRYEDSHEAVQHLSEDIATLSQQTIPVIVRQLDDDLAARELELNSRVSSRTRQLRSLPPRMLEEARLTRAATEAANLNATVEQRYQESRLAQSSSLTDVWVLDAAVPAQLPVSDQSKRVLALGIVASIGFALFLVIVIDRFDPRVSYPAEVSRQMGLTILGAVPHLKARAENGAITPAAAEEVTEAFRGIRLALTHACAVSKPLMLTISSSGPGDGKSFTTSNLGLSFALAGYRTLMIDADLRRGALHRAFGVERRPGLTECLRGEISARAVVQPTTFSSLGIIGSGTRNRLAPELLGGPRMKTMIDELSSEFDIILCDSPPLSAGVDPYLLATLTGQLLIVLRTGVSVRSVLAAKLAVLDQMPVRVVGAVLNAVPYGSLYQPYSYYVAGYAAEDEVEPTVALPRA